MRKFLLLTLSLLVSLGAMAAPERARKNAGFQSKSKENVEILPGRPTASSFTGSTRAAGDYFYGYMVYSTVDYDLGIYRLIPGRGYRMQLVDPYEQLGFDMMPFNGWYENGNVNGLSMFYLDPYTPMGYFYYSMDFETGELLEYTEYPNWYKFDTVFEICTLNQSDGKIYGFAVDTRDVDWKYYWAWASPEDPTNIHIIREAEKGENFFSLCYKPDEKCFYGITYDFNFVSITPEGEITYINYVPYYAESSFARLQSGLIWSEADQVFYWNGQVYVNAVEFIYGCLMSITLDGEFNLVEEYSMDQQFSFFFTTDKYIDPKSPQAAAINGLKFEGPSLSGTMNVTLPTLYGDGSPLPEEISYTALLNDKPYSTGTGVPGSVISIEYTVPESGEYRFGIYVTSNGNESDPASISSYVGYDTPMAPTNIVLSIDKVTWDAVTEGVHDGYIDLDNISYKVTLNGTELGEVKGLSYGLDLLKDPELKKYTVTIAAVSDGIESEESQSNSVIAGKPVALPLSYMPTLQQFDTMTIYNANGDSYYMDNKEITWELDTQGLYSGGTEWANSSMDDYIFLPPVFLTEGENNCKLTFECGKILDWYPKEYLNVVVATSPYPEFVKEEILSQYEPKVYLRDSNNNWSIWDELELNFAVPSNGVYYVGFQCVSAPQQYGIYLRNIDLSVTFDAGVEAIQDSNEGIISSIEGHIVMDGFAGKNVQISGIDGKMVYGGKVSDNNFRLGVNPGIYVVRSGKKVAKVIVR